MNKKRTKMVVGSVMYIPCLGSTKQQDVENRLNPESKHSVAHGKKIWWLLLEKGLSQEIPHHSENPYNPKKPGREENLMSFTRVRVPLSHTNNSKSFDYPRQYPKNTENHRNICAEIEFPLFPYLTPTTLENKRKRPKNRGKSHFPARACVFPVTKLPLLRWPHFQFTSQVTSFPVVHQKTTSNDECSFRASLVFTIVEIIRLW